MTTSRGICFFLFSIVAFLTCLNNAFAGKYDKSEFGLGSIYFSVGFNKEWYSASNLHVDQPILGNNYDLQKIDAQDKAGFNVDKNNKTIFPQYNVSIGYYFNRKQDLALEFNLDRIQYFAIDNQNLQLQGNLNHVLNPQMVLFSKDYGFYYNYKNGSKCLLINFVKRYNCYQSYEKEFTLDFLMKAGMGPVLVNVENSLYTEKNNAENNRLGGWLTALETSLKMSFFKYTYLEIAQKLNYASLSNINVYEGIAKQNFGFYELIFSIGCNLPTYKSKFPSDNYKHKYQY